MSCSKRIEEMRFIRTQTQRLLEECPRLGKIADIQGEDAPVIKLIGVSWQSRGVREFLIANLNESLRPSDDFDFIREPRLQVFEHRLGFGILATIENLYRMLEGA